MAKTVNYAGTVLGLNTDKFKKSLNTVKSDVHGLVNSITSSFKGLAGGFVALVGIKSSFDAITSSMKEMEQSVSSLSSITGSISSAKTLFGDLNNLSREIPQSFSEITQSAITLNKAGLAPSTQLLKSLSAIAVGTGNSLTSVAQIVTNASLGQMKSLKQLGIVATQTSEGLIVEFNGQKETIEATNVAIADYIQRIADSRYSETLQYQMQGLTGATKRVGEAWGDLWRAIATGGVGQAIADSMEGVVRTLDRITVAIQSVEGQQVLGSLVRAFQGAFETISNGVSAIWTPFQSFFTNLSDTGADVCKAEIGYFEGWFDFVRLGLGDLTSQLSTWYETVQAYAERAGAYLHKVMHGTTAEISMRADMQLRVLEKIKELGLENTPLVNPRTQKVDLSQILLLPKDHPLRTFYDEQRTVIANANKQLQDDEVASADVFQRRLKDIEEKARKERNSKYDELRDARLKTLQELDSKSIATYKNVERVLGGKAGSGTSGNVSAMQKLKDVAEETRRAYEQLTAEIDRMKFNQLDSIEQEKVQYNSRLETLNNALAMQVISNDQYRMTEEQLTALHLSKLTELYDQRYKDEAQKRKETLDAIKQQEEDWISGGDAMSGLDAFTKKIEKYGVTWNDLVSGHFNNAKLTAGQIAGVYAQASGALSDYFGSVASGFDQSSSMYKTMFALQKSFAIASSLISVYQGVSNAMAAPWPTNLVAWLQVLAQGMNIVSQIRSISFAGAHDKGGFIPSGALGLVGENGPEFIRGPATITSTQQTAGLLGRQQAITINVVEDASRAGQQTTETSNTEQIINIFVANIRNGGQSASVLESTYGLKRVGY